MLYYVYSKNILNEIFFLIDLYLLKIEKIVYIILDMLYE